MYSSAGQLRHGGVTTLFPSTKLIKKYISFDSPWEAPNVVWVASNKNENDSILGAPT